MAMHRQKSHFQSSYALSTFEMMLPKPQDGNRIFRIEHGPLVSLKPGPADLIALTLILAAGLRSSRITEILGQASFPAPLPQWMQSTLSLALMRTRNKEIGCIHAGNKQNKRLLGTVFTTLREAWTMHAVCRSISLLAERASFSRAPVNRKIRRIPNGRSLHYTHDRL